VLILQTLHSHDPRVQEQEQEELRVPPSSIISHVHHLHFCQSLPHLPEARQAGMLGSRGITCGFNAAKLVE